jgi:3D (Asp-Asp-Asp) domain-containing protein
LIGSTGVKFTVRRVTCDRERQGPRKCRYRQFLPAALLVIAAGCTRIHPAPPPAGASPDTGADVRAGNPVTFSATAYCSGSRTSAGTRVAEGIIAADPAIVPIGSVVKVSGLERRYNGIYTVMDTGAKIRGRRIDLYLRDCRAAEKFGRRPARVAVVRRGWQPRATAGTPD